MIKEQEIDFKIIKRVKDLISQEKNSKERLVLELDYMIQSLTNRQERLLKISDKKFNAKLEANLLKLNNTLAEIHLLKAAILVCRR